MCDRGDYSFEGSIRHYRQLVQIIAAHDFQSLDDGSIDRDRSKLIQRSHDYIQGLIWPLCVGNVPDFLRSYKADNPPVFRHNEAPPAASQKMLVREAVA